MDKNKKTWKEALKLIPNGNLFLSKNPNRFLKNHWPTYFTKSKGCEIWDLNKKKYYDLSLMGVGTNILGYANYRVDREVENVIKKGNLTTLNCPEEVLLAKKLVSLHPWSNMARFAKTGGEANSIAVRIARSYTKKDIIIICGYHGWYDWYLAANLENKNKLDTHLFKDLKFNGVPKSLKGTVKTFEYNDFEKLKFLINKYKGRIAAVKMEVQREKKPKNNFLSQVRSITKKNKILLIFDECTSGFRETNGGLHKKYNVEPDIAWFGKAMGNGYAITAIIGKDSVMDSAQDSFISSTFWTERIGPTAAIKTLDEMEKIKSWEIITKIGKKIRKNWEDIAKRNGINIQISGIPALSSFAINSSDWIKYKTFITQEMLKSNILASNAIFVCTKHDKKILDLYFDKLDEIFKKIEKFENKSINIDNELETDVSQTGFKRLN